MTVERLQEFGETIFATMTALAVENDAVNLGQGFPDSDGPQRMLEIAQENIAGGNNQYAPLRGVPDLVDAIAETYSVPQDHVVVTAGATEAITATVLGLVEPRHEVIVLEPYYDAYIAAIALADATRIPVPLKESGNSWDIDVDAVRAAITDKTAMVIINTPHNPTGSVFSREALTELAELCVEKNLLVLADEVYENLTFGTDHVSIASLPGMAERTVTVSSAAKSFNCTGWKTGWAIAEPKLLDGVIKAKQFTTFVSTTPFQPAVAHALRYEQEWLDGMVSELAECRSILVEGLKQLGFHVHDTGGTYYVVADISSTGLNGIDFCMQLPETKGVAAIPLAAFTDNPEPWQHKVRFAFCKRPEVIREAVRRLTAES
ncbi:MULTISPECIES: aminotransferase class I/II-fold pyridoxal phosphate-dependent enzyme [unclassified Corynebacterium]|uniref:aminotransferase class I/II-fold pyridoxal phosphate-dependent enzyme n=1 Tax=unclassified Corynebacterium TaxID=2624378 RepID=UPI0008A41735|nr:MULTISPECIES: aminotransferase class I/II-fold pyridoxal phosphate-dependent enzyme [unclassified Corynebacterium]OFK69171.1 aminotransferase [Corynebacterium sp. HMSC074A09]OFO21321.1 aminotransferase [Corynebacterium sp. HMSC056F09]OFP32096.1 aminotransferase [Corynebacterium sp. HMSC068G04]